MRKFIVLLIAVMFALTGCVSGKDNDDDSSLEYSRNQEFSRLYSGEITSFDYLVQTVETTYEMAAVCVDGLVDYDKYGVLQPALATDWEVSDDGLVWTFHLRKDAVWVDFTGREYAGVTARDWVASAKYILDKKNASGIADLLYTVIKNAREYYEGTDPESEWEGAKTSDFRDVGVKALDNYTVQYTLYEPVPYFLSSLTWVAYYPVCQEFLDEVGTKFGADNKNILYCGAWRMEEWEAQGRRVYVKNDAYWNSENVYITKSTQIYNAEATTLAPEMFVRGELTYADISTAILDEWLNDPERQNMVRPSVPSYYTYFYAFNFDPRFDAEYEPENWKLAVNNRNFRLAVFHALNRLQAVTTSDPYNPESNLIKTITPPEFCDVDGMDYVNIGALAEIQSMPAYDEELAAEYRDAAKRELEEAGAAFPIKILMPYNTSNTTWGDRCQIVKQNLEKVLGVDFVEIIIDPQPPTNFLGNVRRSGKYALLECNWGPDFADPETYAGPFTEDSNYNWPHLTEGYTDANGKKHYTNLYETAMAEKLDIKKRYELFAEAEAFLIKEAFVIPYVRSVPGWVAAYYNPFDYNYSSFGLAGYKITNVRKLEKPIDRETFAILYDEWKAERAEALKKAAGN